MTKKKSKLPETKYMLTGRRVHITETTTKDYHQVYARIYDDKKDAFALIDVHSLIKLADKFEINSTTKTIGAFLDYLDEYELSDDRNDDEASDAVFVGTVHKAKGLEFDTVFVVDFNEGSFPLNRRGKSAENVDVSIAEEYNIAYVAFTRAKNDLFLFSTQYARYA